MVGRRKLLANFNKKMEEQITTLAEGELLDLVLQLGDDQINTETKVADLEKKFQQLDKMTLKKRVNVIERDGVNHVVVPKDEEVFVRVLYTVDRTSENETDQIRFDGLRRCMLTLGHALATWVTKPGFHIIAEHTATKIPLGTLHTIIIGVDKTHTSQEDS